MAMTLLDAFYVKIGWDTTDWDKGKAKLDKESRELQTREKKHALEIERANKKISDSFRKTRNEVLGLFLAFQGASSLKGFVTDIIASDAAMGRLSDNLGIGIGRLAGWQGAAQALGGTAQDAANALQLLVTAQQNLALTGTTGHDADFKRFGITGNDLKNPEDALLKIASVGESMSKPELFARLTRIGFSAPVINLLERGKKGVSDLVREQEKNANITEKDAKAAQEFDVQLAKLQTTVVGKVRPAITDLLTTFNDYVSSADGAANSSSILVGAVTGLGAAAILALPGWFKLAAVIGVVMEKGDEYLRKHPEAQSFLDTIESPLRGILPDWMLARPGQPGYVFGGGGSAPSGGSYAGSVIGGGGSYAAMLIARGIPADKARGIAAGIAAEGGTATAFNGAGGGQGAFGIGQWRGARLKALRARYGRNPSLAQQMDFLTWELRGGDSGMAMALGAGGGSSGAMEAYLRHGMRPGSGLAGDLRRGYAALGGRAPVGGSGSGTTVNIQSMSVNTPNPENFIKKDLPGQLRRHGVILQNSSGMSQ